MEDRRKSRERKTDQKNKSKLCLNWTASSASETSKGYYNMKFPVFTESNKPFY